MKKIGTNKRTKPSSHRARDLIWNLSDQLLVLLDGDGQIIDANPCFQAAVTLDIGARPTLELRDFLNAEDREAFVACCARVHELEEEGRVSTKLGDGTSAWNRILWRINISGKNQLLAIGSEERLVDDVRLSAEDRSALLDLSNDAIVVRDLAGQIIYWNGGAERLYGYTREEAVGRRIADLLDMENSIELRSIGQALLLTTGNWKGEFRQRTARGSSVHVSSNWILRQRNGVTTVFEICSDITSASKARGDLEGSETRYRSIFERNSAALFEMDFTRALAEINSAPALAEMIRTRPTEIDRAVLNGLLSYVWINNCNPAAVRLLSVSHKSEVLGPFSRWVAVNDCNVPAIFKAMLDRDTIFEDECKIHGAAELTSTVAIGFSFPRDEATLDRVIVAMLDVSSAHEQREELAHAHFELAREGRVAAVGAFSASIVHELNQPLSALLMNVSASIRWLNRPEPNLEAARNSAVRAKLEGERATAILERTKSKMTTDRTRVTRYSIGELILGTIDILKRDLEAAVVDVDLRIPNGLSEIVGDPVGIQQVLVNLINNGVEAMADNPGAKHLVVSVVQSDQQFVKICVSDVGHGIVAENQKRIFTPFFTTKPSGMGIGLAICASIVDAAGGVLSARNNPGSGATFEVTLPLSPPGRDGALQ
jgi:PAS domain S-box-containing protein